MESGVGGTLSVILTLLVGGGMAGCSPQGGHSTERTDTDWSARRTHMVRTQIEARGVQDARVLDSRRPVKRIRARKSKAIALLLSSARAGCGRHEYLTISWPVGQE